MTSRTNRVCLVLFGVETWSPIPTVSILKSVTSSSGKTITYNIVLWLSYDMHLVCPQNHRRSDIPTWGTDRVYSGNIAGWSDIRHSRLVGGGVGRTVCTSGVTKKWVSEDVTHSTETSFLTYSSILPFSTLETPLTFRRLMSYIYGAPILNVSRSHTTTQHSR